MAATGRPTVIASSSVSGRPSVREGMQSRSQRRMIAGTRSEKPGIASGTPSSAAELSSSARSRPSPTTSTPTAGCSSRSAAAMRSTRSKAFSSDSRPTPNNTGECSVQKDSTSVGTASASACARTFRRSIPFGMTRVDGLRATAPGIRPRIASLTSTTASSRGSSS